MSLGDLFNADKLIAAVFKVFLVLLAFLFLVQVLLLLLCRMSIIDIGIVLTCAIMINAAVLNFFGGRS